MNIESDKVYLYRVPIDEPTVPFSAYQELASEALSKLNVVLPDAGTVLLKPNATVLYEPDRRIITHPGFLAGIIDTLVDWGVNAGRVLVADGGTGESESDFTWKNAGYADLAASRGTHLKCFNEASGRPIAIEAGRVYQSLPIYEDVIDCAFLFNVPLAKCHNLGCTTLAMKNLMGVVVKPERHLCSIQEIDKPFEETIWRLTTETGLSHFEDRFYDKLCDLLTAVRSLKMPRLSMVDGMIGRDGTAFNEGANHPLGWTVIGENEVHVDSVATYLMGLDPVMTPYLRAATERGLGCNQISEIDVVDLATDETMDEVALGQARRSEPLMPIAGYGERYYNRFGPDGAAVPWHLEDVNEQLKRDGKPPIAAELRPC